MKKPSIRRKWVTGDDEKCHHLQIQKIKGKWFVVKQILNFQHVELHKQDWDDVLVPGRGWVSISKFLQEDHSAGGDQSLRKRPAIKAQGHKAMNAQGHEAMQNYSIQCPCCEHQFEACQPNPKAKKFKISPVPAQSTAQLQASHVSLTKRILKGFLLNV